MALLADWQVASFVTTPFTQWWSEWQDHLFSRAVNLYYTALNNNYQTCENEVQTKSTFTTFPNISCMYLLTITSCKMMIEALHQSAEAVSRSTMLCRPINPISVIMLHLLRMQLLGKKCKLSYTKVISRKKKKSPSQPSTAATSQIDDLANPPSPPSEGKTLNSLVISFHLNTEYIFVS